MKKKFLLFDFDGTLADSQILYDICASKSLYKINKKYTLEYCVEFFNGRGWKDIFEEIKQQEPEKDVENAYNEALKEAKALTTNEIIPTKNAKEVLIRAKVLGYQLAICSNSSLNAIKHHIELCGFSGIFEPQNIFTLESVKNPKPSPEIYLEAISNFGAKREECLIIEDSLAGLLSASNAEVDALFYKGASHNANNPKKIKNVLATLKEIKNSIVGEIDDLINIFDYLK